MPARCFARDGGRELAQPVLRALRALAPMFDEQRLILASPAVDPATLVVAEPGAGFVLVAAEPDPDWQPEAALARLDRALAAEWKTLGREGRPGGTALLVLTDATPPEGAATLPLDAFPDAAAFVDFFDGVAGSVDDKGMAATMKSPGEAAEALARRHGLDELPAEFLAAASQTAPEIRPLTAPAVAAAAAAPVRDESEVRARMRIADNAVRNRFARSRVRRSEEIHDRAAELQRQAEAVESRLAIYFVDLVDRCVLVPPTRLEGAHARRTEIETQLSAVDETLLHELFSGTMKRLHEGRRSDDDREGLLEAVEMFRSVARARAIRLPFAPGVPESRALNARRALVDACATHFFDSNLAAERILAIYRRANHNIDDVLVELRENPRAAGRPRTRPGSRRPARENAVDGPRQRRRKAPPPPPDWQPLDAALGGVRKALETIAGLEMPEGEGAA